MTRLHLLTLSLMAITVVACHSAPPPLSRSELLEKLKQCRDELSKEERPTGQPPACAKLDPWPLNGISRSELGAALGPPSFCMGLSERGYPRGADCPPDLNPAWSFGRTGVSLSCEADDKQRCEVRWISSR